MANSTWKVFERTVAARLGEWWDGDKNHFRRLPLKAGTPWSDQRGPDVVRLLDPTVKSPQSDVIDYKFPFFIEVKHRKAFNFFDFLNQEPGDSAATAWYAETARRAETGGKLPMVFSRYPSSHRILILVPQKIIKPFSDVAIKNGLRYIRVTFPRDHRKAGVAALIDAKAFFETITAKALIETLARLK